MQMIATECFFHRIHVGPTDPTNQPQQAIPPMAPQTQQASSSGPIRDRMPSPQPSSMRPPRNTMQNVSRTDPQMQPSLQGHRPGLQSVPPGIMSASVPVNSLAFAPFTIFGQDMGPTATATPQPPSTSASGPPPPRVSPEGTLPPWQATTGIAPSQTHFNPPSPPNQGHIMQRPPQWHEYGHDGHAGEPIPTATTGHPYDYRYREDGTGWVPTQPYYDPGVSEE